MLSKTPDPLDIATKSSEMKTETSQVRWLFKRKQQNGIHFWMQILVTRILPVTSQYVYYVCKRIERSLRVGKGSVWRTFWEGKLLTWKRNLSQFLLLSIPPLSQIPANHAPQHTLQICHPCASTIPEPCTSQTFRNRAIVSRVGGDGRTSSHYVTAPNRLRRSVWVSEFPGYHTRQSIFLHNTCYSFQVNISRNVCFSSHLVLPHFCLVLTMGEGGKGTQGVTAPPW